jgi:hypothetical protein
MKSCPNCSSKIKRDKLTEHHDLNAFVKCESKVCVYGTHWHRIGELREAELAKAWENKQ